jgi:hypothetical protein
LVSFGNHQYGASGNLGIIRSLEKGLEVANVGLLGKCTVDTKAKERLIGAAFNGLDSCILVDRLRKSLGVALFQVVGQLKMSSGFGEIQGDYHRISKL